MAKDRLATRKEMIKLYSLFDSIRDVCDDVSNLKEHPLVGLAKIGNMIGDLSKKFEGKRK